MIERREAGPPAEVRVHHRHPALAWPLVAAMTWLSMGGFAGGIPMLRDPTGRLVGAKLSWLDRTPVNDFFVPGLFLVAVYGVGVLLLIAGLLWTSSPGPTRAVNRLTGHHWSWVGTIAVGAVLVAWIAYEYVVFPTTSWLMPALLAVGALMIALPMAPSMRRFYASPQDEAR